MARCQSCNKFVSYDTEVEPEEVGDPVIEGETFRAEYERKLTCADCSEDLKTASIEVECEVTVPKKCKGDEEHDWDFDLTVSPTERFEGKGRGMRTYYGVEVSGKATCKNCEKEIAINAANDEQASAFDDA